MMAAARSPLATTAIAMMTGDESLGARRIPLVFTTAS
jgi:hypothetical protein